MMMKVPLDIVAVLNQSPRAGGGYHQSINSLATLADACRDRHRIRAVNLNGSQLDLERIVRTRPSLRGLEWLELPRPSATRASRYLERARLNRLFPGRKRRSPTVDRAVQLDGLGADLVYFLSPNQLALRLARTPFAITVWDLCHRAFPEFPEVRADGEFERREAVFGAALPKAVLVVTDSARLSDHVHRAYGVQRDRLIEQPFQPSPFVEDSLTSSDTNEVLAHYSLQPGYWFYPAQFWAHKNHRRIVEALALLRTRGSEQRVVFAGGDKGFRSTVERYVENLGLTSNVRFLGFVPSEHLRGLYLGSIALVFPSYFGPTNLPPLEAAALGVPIVCSDFHSGTLGEAARYFDPDDAGELADAMEATVRDVVSGERSTRGHHRDAAPRRPNDATSVRVLSEALERLALRTGPSY